MRIRGHVNYALGDRLMPAVPTRRERVNHRKPDYEGMYLHILARAKLGMRAPTNGELQAYGASPSHILAKWAKAGRIRIEVWPHNWRVILIEGYETAPCPMGGKPYLVIDGGSAVSPQFPHNSQIV